MTAAQDLLEVLTPEERARRAELEEQVLVGAHAALLAGRALREIRDARLYRDTHATFELYVTDRFRFSRQRGYQLIQYAEISDEAEEAGLVLSNERIARALSTVNEDHRAEALQVLSEVTGPNPSTAEVKAVVDAVRDLAHGAAVEHPVTGQPVPWNSLPPEQRAPALGRAVQRGAKDRTDFQGTDDVKPWEWTDGIRRTAQGSIHFDKDGYRVEITDTVTGKYWITRTAARSMFDAIRAARALIEGETTPEDAP